MPSQSTQPRLCPASALPPISVTGLTWRALDHISGGMMVSASGDPIRPIRVMPFWEAFTGQHTSDLFAVMYGAIGLDPRGRHTSHAELPDVAYRLTTNAPAALEEAHRTGMMLFGSRRQVVGTMFAIDMDLKDVRFLATGKVTTEKLTWTQDLRDRFIEELWEPACAKMPILRQPTLWYATAHGMRLIYVLTHPIPILETGGHFDRYRGLLVDMFLAGIPIDRATKDWTRLQRLPMVMRETTDPRGNILSTAATWTADYFRMSWGRVDPNALEEVCPQQVLVYPPEAFEPISSREPGIEQYLQHPQFAALQSLWLGIDSSLLEGCLREHVECGRQPSPEEAANLVYREGDLRKPTITHKNLKATVEKIAKKAATGNGHAAAAASVYAVMWEGRRLDLFTDPPSIHNSAYSLAYELCHLAEDQLGMSNGQVTPQLVYALILPRAQEANDARGREEAEGSARGEDELADEVWRVVCHAFSWRWNHREEAIRAEQESCVDLSADTQRVDGLIVGYLQAQGWPAEEAQEHWRKMLLLSTDFGTSCIRIVDDRVTYGEPIKGRFGWITNAAWSAPDALTLFSFSKEGDKALRNESDILFDHGVHVGSRVRYSRLIERTELRRVVMGREAVPELVVKIPGIRTDIEAQFHADIDEWLRAFGETDPEQFLDHLATFIDLAIPWPAMYKGGYPDEGKNMLLEGLKRVTESRKAAQFTDAIGNFQDDLKDTPLLVVNEGSSTANGHFQKSVNEVLRDYIGADETRLNQKGVKGISVDGCWRIFISANHEGAMDWGQNLTQTDVDAIRRRVGFYGPSRRAVEILRQAGGRTGNDSGPGTVAGRWVDRIAEHIMWLHSARQVKPSSNNRFALEINSTPWHDRQRAKGFGQLVLCRAIAVLVRSPSRNEEALKVVPVPKNNQRPGVYISPEQFYREMCVILIDERRSLPSLERTITILQSMCHDGKVQYRTNKRTRARGFRLDIANFLSVLNSYGLDCDMREELGDAWKEVSLDVRRAVELESAEVVGEDEPQAFGGAAITVGGAEQLVRPSRVVPFPGSWLAEGAPGPRPG